MGGRSWQFDWFRYAQPILLVSLLASPALADVRHNVIPVALHGTWASHTQHCRTPDQTIVLAKNSYVGPKGRCAVPWVIESAGARGTIYSAHLRCPTEREGGEHASTLIVMRSGANQISVGDEFDGMKAYERCSE
jgi:hypothetical protein